MAQRKRTGRTARPRDPAVCPECREVMGRPGLSRHLQAPPPTGHGYAPERALRAAREAFPAAGDGGTGAEALVATSLALQERLRALRESEAGTIPEHAANAARETWERQLAEIREALQAELGPPPTRKRGRRAP